MLHEHTAAHRFRLLEPTGCYCLLSSTLTSVGGLGTVGLTHHKLCIARRRLQDQTEAAKIRQRLLRSGGGCQLLRSCPAGGLIYRQNGSGAGPVIQRGRCRVMQFLWPGRSCVFGRGPWFRFIHDQIGLDGPGGRLDGGR